MMNSTDPVPRCNVCPKGHYCPTKTQWPIPCDSGYYSSSTGATACTICPAGSACAFPHEAPVACPTTATSDGVEGYTSAAGATSCYPVYGSCTAGYYKYPEPMAT
jgi:hypothetical protein